MLLHSLSQQYPPSPPPLLLYACVRNWMGRRPALVAVVYVVDAAAAATACARSRRSSEERVCIFTIIQFGSLSFDFTHIHALSFSLSPNQHAYMDVCVSVYLSVCLYAARMFSFLTLFTCSHYTYCMVVWWSFSISLSPVVVVHDCHVCFVSFALYTQFSSFHYSCR